MGDLIGYFGYGSLVNKQTLRTRYISAHPASLKGWRRHWQSYPGEGVERALLSIHEHPETIISGMLVIDRLENLPALDEREAFYRRVNLSAEDLILHDDGCDIEQFHTGRLFVYVAQHHDDKRPPLLQSYLDAVMAGFHKEFGDEGLEGFLKTTVGFDREIIPDRDAPLYPRAVSIDRNMAALFDASLRAIGAHFA